MFIYVFLAIGWSQIWMIWGIQASFNGQGPYEGCRDGACDQGCHPGLWHAVRGLVWYYIIFEGVVAVALVCAAGYALTHPKVVSDTLQIGWCTALELVLI